MKKLQFNFSIKSDSVDEKIQASHANPEAPVGMEINYAEIFKNGLCA